MPDFIMLTCPTCGGKLQITDKISAFACGYCGNEHLVHREGGMIYLAPLAQDVRQIRVGVDKTAAELAIVRLVEEIEQLEREYRVVKQSPPIYDEPAPPDYAGNAPESPYKGLVILMFVFVFLFTLPLTVISIDNGSLLLALISMVFVFGSVAYFVKTAVDRAAGKRKMDAAIDAAYHQELANYDMKYKAEVTAHEVELERLLQRIEIKRTQLVQNRRIVES